jgi:hypothetical protein
MKEAASYSPAACYKHLPELWRKLKDGIALWLLSRSFQEAGLPLPVGLLALPQEVKDKILGFLKVCTRCVSKFEKLLVPPSQPFTAAVKSIQDNNLDLEQKLLYASFLI